MERADVENRSTLELLREIGGKTTLLVAKEIELARVELKQDLQQRLAVWKAYAVAAVFATTALNLFVVAGVLAASGRVAGWIAASIAAVGALLVAAAAVWIGRRRLAGPPLAVSRQSIEEDLEWARQRIA
jgi:membrane protein DedA with SNARE-associated domain